MKFNKLYFGADYYPEHWPEERFSEDAKLMKAAGFNVVRMAEFAWSKMEPREGQYEFDWLDRAINVLNEQDIQIVLGTPTASPPAWLMAKDPEMFMVKEDGTRLGYGNRREYCPNHSMYRVYTEKIVTKMVERYKDHPAVIGWQIDNEFGARCYCDTCRAKFQEWLQARFKNLDELNEKWGTVFWGHTFSDWLEIPIPLRLGSNPLDTSPNPGLALDYFRFMSDTYVNFQKVQIDIIRRNCPRHFITHNLMGFKYPYLNYFDLAEDLDFVSWDNYCRTQWTMEADVAPSIAALNHDAMRGLKRANFWVMEQQSGPGGWEMVSASTKPGEIRLWAYQAIARGANAIIFFRWRTCRFGTEEYWHGVLDHHGIPGRRYKEVSKMGAEINQIGEKINGSLVKSTVAILQSYDTRFAFQIQNVNPQFKYETHFHDIYKVFYEENILVDVISEKDDFSGYKLVVVPTMYVLTKETVENLEKFVQAGGYVVFTGLTGVKDLNNTVVNQKLPGLASNLSGVEVEEYVSIPLYDENEIQFLYQDLEESYPVQSWAEILEAKGSVSIATYTKDFFADRTAATINTFGKGRVVYLGTIGTYEYYKGVILWLAKLVNLHTAFKVPKGVEVTERWQGEKKIVFFLNFTDQNQLIELNGEFIDIINGCRVGEEISIAGRDLLILTLLNLEET